MAVEGASWRSPFADAAGSWLGARAGTTAYILELTPEGKGTSEEKNKTSEKDKGKEDTQMENA